MRLGRARALPVAIVAASLLPVTHAAGEGVADYVITDAGIEAPLTREPGDPERGREIAVDPMRGNCLICHAVPDAPEERFQGDVGPRLAGVGARLHEPWLRLRVVDGTRIHADTVMPAYHRVEGLNRVAPQWRGRPVLSPQEVEDVVAWLASLTAGR